MRVLVVAAHPDDEVLGCGGTVARHGAAGDRVDTLIVAEGATSRSDANDSDGFAAEVVTLQQCARIAAGILGAAPPRFGALPDNRLDGLELLDVIKRIESVIADVVPDLVYTHHSGDLNVDHRIVHQAVVTACRPLPRSPVTAIFTFETVSSTEWAGDIGPLFRPQRFVDISASLPKKIAALRAYASEMRPFPHARSLAAVEALAQLRGSQAGFTAAEAFGVALERVLE